MADERRGGPRREVVLRDDVEQPRQEGRPRSRSPTATRATTSCRVGLAMKATQGRRRSRPSRCGATARHGGARPRGRRRRWRAQLAAQRIEVKARAGEGGKLFGSVTTRRRRRRGAGADRRRARPPQGRARRAAQGAGCGRGRGEAPRRGRGDRHASTSSPSERAPRAVRATPSRVPPRCRRVRLASHVGVRRHTAGVGCARSSSTAVGAGLVALRCPQAAVWMNEAGRPQGNSTQVPGVATTDPQGRACAMAAG